MTRRTLLSMLATALIALVITLTAGTERAQAQQNLNCCNYSVEISGVKPACFPLRIKTQWLSGGISYTDIITYPANGVYWNLIPGPCPPAPTFDWVSLNLGGTQVHLGETKQFIIGGCCYKATATLNANFCILIKITSC